MSELPRSLEDQDLADFIGMGFAPPQIPPDWINVTWSNDVCPSWKIGLLTIWADHPVPEEREVASLERFSVCVSGWNPEEGEDTESGVTALKTDDWAEVLKFVADNPDLAQMRTRSLKDVPEIS